MIDYRPRGESHYNAKLNEQQVWDCLDMRHRGYLYREIAVKHGITVNHVANIVGKRRWRHLFDQDSSLPGQR